MPPGKKRGKIIIITVKGSEENNGVTWGIVLSTNKAIISILSLANFDRCLHTCSSGQGRGFHYCSLDFLDKKKKMGGGRESSILLLGRRVYFMSWRWTLQREKGERGWLSTQKKTFHKHIHMSLLPRRRIELGPFQGIWLWCDSLSSSQLCKPITMSGFHFLWL